MKKIIIISLAVLSLAVSCTKETPVQTEQQQVFTAFGADSKTVLSGTSILWENGDAIQVYNGESGPGAAFTTTLSEPSAQAEFTGSGAAQVGGKYYAMYPAGAFPTKPDRGFSDKYIYFFVPNEQIAVNGKLPENTNIMYAGSETTTFHFKHAVAFIKFSIGASSPAIKAVTFAAPGAKVSGTFRYTYSSGKIGTYNLDGSINYEYVNLKSGDGNALAAGEYYMAVNAGSYANGVKFIFTDVDGKILVKNISGAQSLAYGDLMDIGTVKLDAGAFVDPMSKRGDAYSNGNDKGVVFWINPEYPLDGKVISSWVSKKKTFVSDASITIFSEKPSCKNETGSDNVAILKATDTYKNAPEGTSWAFEDCEKETSFKDGGWYLPSNTELRYFFGAVHNLDYETAAKLESKSYITYNETTYKKFNDSIVSLGGKDGYLAGQTKYWSSDLTSAGNKMVYTRFDTPDAGQVYFYSNNYEFTQTIYVRCAKKVTLSY